jgi:hypothetical protein
MLTTFWDYWIVYLPLSILNAVHLENTTVNFIYYSLGFITLLHSSHFQALLSFITILDWARHPIWCKAPVQSMNFEVISHLGREFNYNQAGMAGLQWFLLCSTQYQVHDLVVHQECPPALQDNNPAIQLFNSNTISTPPEHPCRASGSSTKASYQHNSWCQCNGEKLIFQGIGIVTLTRANLPQCWCNQSVW